MIKFLNYLIRIHHYTNFNFAFHIIDLSQDLVHYHFKFNYFLHINFLVSFNNLLPATATKNFINLINSFFSKNIFIYLK